MYHITNYTKQKAKELNVTVKPSSNKKKKIDVYKDGKKVASIGAISYQDYPTYLKTKGKEYAEERRRLYKLRHSKDRTKEGSPGWWSDQLLW
jgi:hypothetical protein